MVDTQVGKAIQRLRRQHGLTQEALARLSHLSSSTIARIEQGKTRFPRETELARIAAVFKVEPSDLLNAAGAAAHSSSGVGSNGQEASLGNLRAAADFLVQLGEADERDIPTIISMMERLAQMIEAVRAGERHRGP